MTPKAFTTFGELAIGDRFYFVTATRGKKIFQKTEPLSYNDIQDGVRMLVHNVYASADKPVIFLRHTLPQPHEQYTIQQLKPGDVFFLPGDIITEYVLLEDDSDEYSAEKLNGDRAVVPVPTGTTVIFIKSIQTA